MQRYQNRHIHSDRGVDKRTMFNSNLIEGLWSTMQRKMRMIYSKVPGGTTKVRDFIYETMWRLELESKGLIEQRDFVRESSRGAYLR
jgi:hypothetical protein